MANKWGPTLKFFLSPRSSSPNVFYTWPESLKESNALFPVLESEETIQIHTELIRYRLLKGISSINKDKMKCH